MVTEIEKAQLVDSVKSVPELHDIARRLCAFHDGNVFIARKLSEMAGIESEAASILDVVQPLITERDEARKILLSAQIVLEKLEKETAWDVLGASGRHVLHRIIKWSQTVGDT